ncbi:hypothetical protein [Natrononativus amylolyticus]|uniref:hypothetical protein n=1 Tax=Natrononativus amylolyticus TaxID=2963434 RepID=UPI0020CEE81F|nr:hypothetical protein [Natrononativus amylolyticus]
MPERNDVTKVLASCSDCHSAYAAREWPDGEVQLIGQDACECGSTEFDVVEGSDIGVEADDRESGAGTGAE